MIIPYSLILVTVTTVGNLPSPKHFEQSNSTRNSLTFRGFCSYSMNFSVLFRICVGWHTILILLCGMFALCWKELESVPNGETPDQVSAAINCLGGGVKLDSMQGCTTPRTKNCQQRSSAVTSPLVSCTWTEK